MLVLSETTNYLQVIARALAVHLDSIWILCLTMGLLISVKLALLDQALLPLDLSEPTLSMRVHAISVMAEPQRMIKILHVLFALLVNGKER